MLSILIPTYNYNISHLVESLYKQITKLDVDYEIIVYDDCSPDPIIDNNSITELNNVHFKILDKNIGRSAIRNLLAKTAKYNNLLFLDADTKVVNPEFIKSYLNHINKDFDIIYGGIRYQYKRPEKNKMLRWKYGKKREALNVKERSKQPYLRFLTLNFLIRKEVFNRIKFNESIPNLRHEDTLFAMDAKHQKINVLHINNPVIHLGLESSSIFLKKSLESIDTLELMIKKGLINLEDVRISKITYRMKRSIIGKISAFLISRLSPSIEKNLLSAKPSIILFDIYRFGYYLKKIKH